MHMYLFFPLLVPLLQYYAPHWMALSPISNSTQKSGGTSLLVQWLTLSAPKAGGPGSIRGQGNRSHMLQLRPGAAK